MYTITESILFRNSLKKGLGYMKGLRPVVIIGVIALFVAAWYSLFNNSKIMEQEYTACLSEARNKANMGIYTDANNSYLKALTMYQGIDLLGEIADYYRTSEQKDAFVEECSTIISKYPKVETGYVKLLDYYYKNQAYTECFTVIDQAKKRRIRSEKIEKIYNDIYYTYKTMNSGIADIGTDSGGFVTIQDGAGNWGYYSEAGFSAIGCNYRQAAPFTEEGYACVYNQEGEFYLINTNNEKKYVDVEKKKIEECSALSSGMMAAKIDGKYSYIDINFKVLFGKYDFAGTFHDTVAAVKDKKGWFIINTNNQKISDTYYADIKLDGAKMAFRNSLAFVSDDNKNYYLMNVQGKKVGQGIWEDAIPFMSDEPTAVKKNGKWGFIDTTGKVAVKPQYEEARPFYNGLAAVKVNGKWGYIDSKNYKLVIPAEFEEAREMGAHGFAFVKLDDEWNVLSLYRFNH